MKRQRCIKTLVVVLLIIAISIYLAVNTIYMRIVFSFEDHFQEEIDVFDKRSLCYPVALTYLKETISRHEEMETDNSVRQHLIQCYDQEKLFSQVMLGKHKLLGRSYLTSQYREIQESLSTERLCQTLYLFDEPLKYD